MNPETPSNPTSSGSSAPIIGNCIQCQGMVRIPAKTTPKAEVRCPHCGHTFALLAILERLVPELEVVESESSIERPVIDTEVKKENGKFVVPSQLSKGARRGYRRGGSSRESEKESSSNSKPNLGLSDEIKLAEVTESENGVAISEKPSRALSPRESKTRDRRDRERNQSRRRSKSRATPSSPLVEAIKVVLGAVLAIPIAYLLVFWIFRADPLDVGPSLSKSVPFLVPAQFRGPSTTDQENNSTESKPIEEGGDDKTNGPRVIDPDSPGGGLAIPMVDPELIGRN